MPEAESMGLDRRALFWGNVDIVEVSSLIFDQMEVGVVLYCKWIGDLNQPIFGEKN
jgi:hypothetical protein